MLPWLLLPPVALLCTTTLSSFGGFMVLLAERGERARWSTPLVALFAREAAARALMILVAPGGWGFYSFRSSAARDAVRRVPVLLVPDDKWNRSSLLFLRIFLERRGWAWVAAINPPRGDLGLQERAEHLGVAVRGLLRTSGAPQLDLVGHGTGGLVAAWYARHQGREVVRRLVTVSSPWRGTKMAVFRPGRIAEEAHAGCPVLDGLMPPPPQTTCIWSPEDPSVIPSRNALAEGADSVCIECAGHMEMLVSARVYRAIQAALSQPVHMSESPGPT